jgi:hypothetical protein
MAFVKTKFALPTVTRKDGTLGAYVEYNSNPRGDQFIWPAQRIAILLAKQKAAGKKAAPNVITSKSDLATQARLGSWPAWLTWIVGGIPVVGPAIAARGAADSPGDARVRSSGMDPATLKPIAPVYADALTIQMLKYGIDPKSPDAMAALAARLRADEAAQRQHDYEQNQKDREPPVSWGKIALFAGGGLIATFVVVKLAK